MPDVHFEIIRLEDIGKDLIKTGSSKKTTSRSNFKLSDGDVENLKHYLHRYNEPSSRQTTTKKVIQDVLSPDSTKPLTATTSHHHHHHHHHHQQHRHHQHDHVDITDDLYFDKPDTDHSKLFEHAQPLTDIYRYHHHYRRQHQHTKHAHEKPNTSILPGNYQILTLKFVTCGMKKNTQLPIPHENFSLINGCFGDDAGFAMRRNQQNFLGISDGAGGNVMYGFDPRLFSESLMRHCSDLAHTGKYSTEEPKRLLCHAFDRVQIENCFGSATACVVGIDCDTGQLHSVNIGDSGYVIVRNGCIIYRSRSQKMNGDCPRQLDVYPWTAALRKKGLNYTQISSVDAICQTFQLELDDIVILSTDGLFDNVPDRLLEKIVSKHHSLKDAANELVNHAVRFYVKPDDILVIMARLTTDKHRTYEQR
ncbi:unnamed protein product [Rotaria magnacalcarata]|uniref:Protein phosphatase n=1 Tax=Rotaria magnacalcarata TaxID=392030 RepID=A0A816FU91_9BILA|nr:unnamed protein product [Rotaria magnacalcarata]CAF1666266.1 unnamed protein product [Rotaria magnacalcarata]CAF3903352.1 unnamed protein product [Rotaria magnacalcarata]CAF3911646.1 unnamed protein product [Rotaria magnacalcarata]